MLVKFQLGIIFAKAAILIVQIMVFVIGPQAIVSVLMDFLELHAKFQNQPAYHVDQGHVKTVGSVDPFKNVSVQENTLEISASTYHATIHVKGLT